MLWPLEIGRREVFLSGSLLLFRAASGKLAAAILDAYG
jgi:hypothetical protein